MADDKDLQQEMRRLKEDIEQREREIERMVGGLIHDLRTPLSIVIEGSDLILEGGLGDLNDSQKEMLTCVKGSGINCMKIASSLLKFVKIMDGVYHPDTTRFNIYPTIDKSLQRFVGRRISEGKSVFVGDEQYKSGLDERVFVDGDEFFTERVLDNLISNAIKYSRQRIGVDVSQDNDVTTVCISDDGQGIPARFHGEIFQPYSDVDQTEQTGYRLGLYTARRLVEAQGGRIGFESTPLVGSKFYFSLPLHKSD